MAQNRTIHNSAEPLKGVFRQGRSTSNAGLIDHTSRATLGGSAAPVKGAYIETAGGDITSGGRRGRPEPPPPCSPSDMLKAISPRATPEGPAAEAESLQRSGDYCVHQAETLTGDQSFFASSDGTTIAFDGTSTAKAEFTDCMRRQGYGPNANSGEAYQREGKEEGR